MTLRPQSASGPSLPEAPTVCAKEPRLQWSSFVAFESLELHSSSSPLRHCAGYLHSSGRKARESARFIDEEVGPGGPARAVLEPADLLAEARPNGDPMP